MTASWTVLARELAEPGLAVARLHLLNPAGLVALGRDPALAEPGRPAGRQMVGGRDRAHG